MSLSKNQNRLPLRPCGYTVVALFCLLAIVLPGSRGFTAEAEHKEEAVFSIDSSITTEGIYDTNVFQTRFNEVDDFYVTLQPRIGLHWGLPYLDLNLGYQPKFIFFTQNFGDNNLESVIQDLKFVAVPISTRYYELAIKDSLQNTQTSFTNPDTPNNLSLQNLFEVKNIFSYDFDAQTIGQATIDFIRSDIEDPGEDYYSYGGSVLLTRDLTEIFTLSVKETGVKTVYDDAKNSNSFLWGSEGGVEVNFSERVSGKAFATYDYLYMLGPNPHSWGYDLDLAAEVTETTTVGVAFEQRLGQDQTAHATKQQTYTGSVQQQIGPRTTFTAEGHLTKLEIPAAFIPEDRLWGASGGIIYDITEKWRAGLRYEFDQNASPGNNEFTAHRGIVELSYDFGKLVNIY